MKFIFLPLLLLFNTSLRSQSIENELSIELYNRIIHNFIFFSVNTIHEVEKNNGKSLVNNNFTIENSLGRFADVHVDMDSHYDLRLNKSGNFITYNKQKYEIIYFNILNQRKANSFSNYTGETDGFEDYQGFYHLMRKGVVAYDSLNNKLIYISGSVYKDNIRPYLKDWFADTIGIVNYIKLRYYNYEPENIRIVYRDPLISLVTFFNSWNGATYRVELAHDSEFISLINFGKKIRPEYDFNYYYGIVNRESKLCIY